MTAKKAMETMDNYFNTQAENYKDSNKALDKVVKEVCANVEFFNEDTDHVMTINFTAKDGVRIRQIKQKNEYCGRYMNLLADIWGCTPTVEDLKKVPSEEIRKVYFYKMTRGEYEFQEFRKANAIEIAQFNTVKNAEEE